MSNMPVDHVLGVDGGGTWTRSVIMRSDGVIIGKGYAGPSNPISAGVDNSLENIFKAVAEAQKQAKVDVFKASRLGLAGASRSILGKGILNRLPSSYGDSVIVSDAESALAGSTGCRPGVVVIAGTGSIVYGVNTEGEKAKAGGWGWRLGDEGSGYTIGNNAVIAALKYQDGRGPPTVLKEMIMNHLKLDSLEDIIDWTYESKREPRHFAYMVPFVKEAEIKGDPVAAKIMRDAGIQLGIVAKAVIERLGLTGDFPVACNGGVFKQPRGYNASFEATVKEKSPDCRFIDPMYSPTIGSALLALQSLGLEISDMLLKNVRESEEGKGEFIE